VRALTLFSLFNAYRNFVAYSSPSSALFYAVTSTFLSLYLHPMFHQERQRVSQVTHSLLSKLYVHRIVMSISASLLLCSAYSPLCDKK